MGRMIVMIILIILVGCTQSPGNASLPADDSNQATSYNSTGKMSTQTKSSHTEQNESINKAFKTDQPGIVPQHLNIPAMNLKAAVEKVGKNEKGAMANPNDHRNAGWYEYGPKPGDQGSSVIAGHVNSPNDTKSVFWNLDQLKKGDNITLTNDQGKTRTFVVIAKENYDYKHAPLKKIFGYSSSRKLNLVTCTGDYNYDAGTHQERLVVYTHLKSEE